MTRPMLRPLALLVLLLAACGKSGAGPEGGSSGANVLRVGHFPNVTHAHGLIAHALTRQGKGWFEERLPGVTIEWFTYNAGPSAMEAILSGSLDLTYVGPSPALATTRSARVRSQRSASRISIGKGGTRASGYFRSCSGRLD